MENLFEGRNLAQSLELHADACVIGTGAGGGAIAAELAEGGLNVVVLEEGGHYTTQDYTSNVMDSMRNLYRNGTASMFIGKPSVAFAEGRCVGGSTVVNGGICWRPPEKILQRWEWEEGLPELSYEKLLPMVEKVERRINVAPQAASSIGRDAELIKLGADRLGYRTSEIRRNQKHCSGSNLCAFGCPTGAKQSTLLSYVPRALGSGARLYSDCKAQRVLASEGRAHGVEAALYRPGARRPHARLSVRAPIVVVSGGATQTPLLLQRSRIGSFSGLIGERVFLHPNIKTIGIFEERIQAWKGVLQGWQIEEFMDEGILLATTMVPPSLIALGAKFIGEEMSRFMKDYNHMMGSGALVEDSDSVGRVRHSFFGDMMSYRLGPRDAHMLKRGAGLMAQVLFAAGAKKVAVGIHGMPPLESPADIAKLFDPRIKPTDLEVLSVHAMGSCRMGGDPYRSVVGPFGEHHQIRGLFVADASVFPGPIGVNPQITIMALATRTGQHILDEQSRYLPKRSPQ